MHVPIVGRVDPVRGYPVGRGEGPSQSGSSSVRAKNHGLCFSTRAVSLQPVGSKLWPPAERVLWAVALVTKGCNEVIQGR